MTEVTQAQSTELANIPLDAFAGAEVSGQDIIIPKVLCMQGQSQLVGDGKAKVGDLVDSLSSQVIGGIDKPIKFIPFFMTKTFVVSEFNGSRYMFHHIEDCTPKNENQDWEQIIDGKKYKFEKSFNFYVLLEEDMSLPYVISFKSTSSKAGRELMTQMYVKNRAAGKVPPAKIMALNVVKESKDGSSYAVLKTSVAGDSSVEQIKSCLEWFKIINSGGVKEHNEMENDSPLDAANPEF